MGTGLLVDGLFEDVDSGSLAEVVKLAGHVGKRYTPLCPAVAGSWNRPIAIVAVDVCHPFRLSSLDVFGV